MFLNTPGCAQALFLAVLGGPCVVVLRIQFSLAVCQAKLTISLAPEPFYNLVLTPHFLATMLFAAAITICLHTHVLEVLFSHCACQGLNS